MRKGIFFPLVILFSNSLFAVQTIKSVNFFQKEEVSKLVIELDGPANAERKHMKQDKQILLDVKNVKAAAKVLRGIDTSEFSGASVYIAGYNKPGSKSDIRFAVQLRDNVNSFLELVDNKIILNIESRFGVFGGRIKAGAKTAEDLTKNEGPDLSSSRRLHVPKSTNILDILANITLSGPKRYVGKRISINVNNMAVSDILRIIAETSGFNIIIDDEVKKARPLTLKLTNLAWDQILDTVLDLAKLNAEKHANILTVTTRAQAETELKEKIAAEKAKVAQEPLVTKIFPISFGKLEDMSKIVEGYLTTERGSVKVDARTNYLIVQDTIEKIERIKKIVEALDTETAQILIESRIVEINDRESFTMGLQTGIEIGYDPITNPSQVNTGPGFTFSSAGSTINSETGGVAGTAVLGLAIESFSRLTNLALNLEFAQENSWLKIISSPRVVTQNKIEAELISEETVSFEQQTLLAGATDATTQSATESINLSLKVTPQVTNEGSINLDVAIEKGEFITLRNTRAPDTVRRVVKTNVLVDNGSTVSIGGLYRTRKSRSQRGVPFLKDIPIIGWLFKTSYNPSVQKDELMVFLTPRIINQEEAGLTGANLSAIKSNKIQ